MHAQDWKQGFDEDVAKAKDRHQQAIAEAHDAFKKAEAESWKQRDAAYRAAEDAFNALKSLSDCPELREASEAFDRAKEPASLSEARKALAEAIERADHAYKAALVTAGEHHNVSVTVHDQR